MFAAVCYLDLRRSSSRFGSRIILRKRPSVTCTKNMLKMTSSCQIFFGATQRRASTKSTAYPTMTRNSFWQSFILSKLFCTNVSRNFFQAVVRRVVNFVLDGKHQENLLLCCGLLNSPPSRDNTPARGMTFDALKDWWISDLTVRCHNP